MESTKKLEKIAKKIIKGSKKKFFADFDWFRYENSGREWIC